MRKGVINKGLVKKTYKQEKNDDNWNREIYITFLKEIGQNLSRRVEGKIADIEENQ